MQILKMKLKGFSLIRICLTSFTKLCQGFSLIEVMIAITIIGVVGVISVAIFTQTLRTSEQTTDLSNLKQNGEPALNTIADAIRNAEAVICYGTLNTYNPPLSSPSAGASPFPSPGIRRNIIVIRTMEGKYVRFRFIDPVVSSGVVTANGYAARQDNLDPTGITDLNEFCTNVTDVNLVSLTNRDITTGVSINWGDFLKLSDNLNKDSVVVRFYVNPTKTIFGIGASENAVLQTTVQVR